MKLATPTSARHQARSPSHAMRKPPASGAPLELTTEVLHPDRATQRLRRCESAMASADLHGRRSKRAAGNRASGSSWSKHTCGGARTCCAPSRFPHMGLHWHSRCMAARGQTFTSVVSFASLQLQKTKKPSKPRGKRPATTARAREHYTSRPATTCPELVSTTVDAIPPEAKSPDALSQVWRRRFGNEAPTKAEACDYWLCSPALGGMCTMS